MRLLIKYCFFFLLAITSFGTAFSQKIIFAQDYHFKNNAFSKKLMGSYIFEDSVSKERLVLLSGSKTINFYVVNDAWKLQKSFEVEMNKKSAFWNDNFVINGFGHSGSKWVVIAGDNGDYTAEVIDTKAGTLTIAGKVFQDKDPKYFGEAFSDGDKNYNMYPTRSGGLAISRIDESAGVQAMNIDVATQMPLNKSKKYTPKEIFLSYKTIDTLTSQQIYYTRSKVQFYKTASAFVFAIVADEPVVELNFFDKTTGSKIKSELFSVESLLPAGVKDTKLNTAMLLYDNKLWIYSGNKNAGVLAAFDVNTKKAVYSKTFDDKMDVSAFNYGPVEYKATPSTGKIFSGESYIKDKVEDVTANYYVSELWKGDLGIYVHPLSDNEYVITVASYNMTSFMSSSAGIRDVPQMTNPRIYESSAAGLIFQKSNLAVSAKKTTYNEVNIGTIVNSMGAIKMEKDAGTDPEYNERRAYIIRQQPVKNSMYTMYYYDDQFKITQKVFPMNIEAMGVK